MRKKAEPQVWRDYSWGEWNRDKVLDKIMGICKESGVGIPDTVTDRAHMIGEPYVEKTTKKIM